MTFLLWLGVIFFSCGWLFAVPIFARVDRAWACAFWGVGAGSVLWACGRGAGWRGAVYAAFVLTSGAMAQSCEIPLFEWAGSRIHRLDFVSPLLYGFLRLLGQPAFLGEGIVYLQASGHLLPFTCDWGKLGLLPALWIATLGGILVLAWKDQGRFRALVRLVLAISVFLVFRFALLASLVMEHPDPRNLELGDHPVPLSYFSHPLWQSISFLPLSLFLAVLAPLEQGECRFVPSVTLGFFRSAWKPFVAAAMGVSACQWGALYQDPGRPKAGRILFDEAHSSHWEVASIPFDTTWYGRESVYNYATFADLLREHYPVEIHREGPYTDEVLGESDVLILKTATRPFMPEEVDAIERFVRRGGGLFLIGDHTDLLGMSTNLNKVASRFGFAFNLDASNRLDDLGFHDASMRLWFAHPVPLGVGPLGFMTSCTLSAPLLAENVLVGRNLFSDPLDYASPSFFGNVVPDTEDDFGLHLLSAACKAGKGRVLAFSDSTIFSNFGVMYEGRPEFLLRAVDYLNRENLTGYRWNLVALAAGAAALLVAGVLLRPVRPAAGLWIALALPWTVASGIIGGAAAARAQISGAYPLPRPKAARPVVAFLEERCDYRLPPALVQVSDPPEKSFDVFFVWLQRIGISPRVLPLPEALERARALVAINPCEPFPPDDIRALDRWVYGGGKLLVMDSVINRSSSANQILSPFGMAIRDGSIGVADLPASDLSRERGERARIVRGTRLPALVLEGGEPVLQAPDGQWIATLSRHGKGCVIACADSFLFSRSCMGGQTEPVEAGDARMSLFEAEFSLFRDHLFGADRDPGPE